MNTIVITGGSGILLSPIAVNYANKGWNVVVVGLGEIPQHLEGIKNIDFMPCDVLNEEAVESLANEVKKKYGNIKVLINGAGGNNPGATTTNEIYSKEDVESEGVQSFFDIQIDKFKWVNELNFLGTVIVTKYFTPLLINEGGNILNVSSMSSEKPMTKVPAYSAAKASVDNFTKWMAVHFAKEEIRVNSIAPGFFLTKQNEKLLIDEDGKLTPRSEKIIKNTPMDRFGKPEDLVEPIIFLTDDSKSGFITGITLEVDGGFSAYSGV